MNIISRIRKSHITKGVAMLLALQMLGEYLWPNMAMALTAGPSQPEVQSFEPVETTDMVDLFTGDFTYNIPLINLPGPNGGYPINLAYHGGVTMDQEASWVGLGWNINAGALVRNVRGFADDYDGSKGDSLITKMDAKANLTIGTSFGVNLEGFGADPGESGLDLSLGCRYNNYRGFAVSTSAGYDFPTGNSQFDVQAGLSLDSQAGLGANASISHQRVKDRTTKRSLGLSYNSEGLGITFLRSKPRGYVTVKTINSKGITTSSKTQKLKDLSGGSSLGFSANTFMPVVSYPSRISHLNLKLKFGPYADAGIYANYTFSGFYNLQKMAKKYKGKDFPQEVYGYENLENAGDKDVMDFTRQKDGLVHKNMANLAQPMLTHDTYSVSGQGLGGYFRPFRTDVGKVHDPRLTTITVGGSINADVSTTHYGIGGTVTCGWSVQKPWEWKNDWKDFTFQQRTLHDSAYAYSDDERLYYRMHGDKSSFETDELDFIGGEGAVQTEFEGKNEFIGLITADFNKLHSLQVPSGISNQRTKEDRISRNTLIYRYKNHELTYLIGNVNPDTMHQSSLEYVCDIPEFSVIHYDWDEDGGHTWSPDDAAFSYEPTHFLERDTRGPDNNPIGHHNAGYKVLNEQGQHYVYALPAYNNLEVESAFTVDGNDAPSANSPKTPITTASGEVDYKISGTNKFLDKKTKPPYAHSYMLTSILGADYVDVDGNGASDDDLGYWVRFDYVKYADNYDWRAPFDSCSYNRGSTGTLDDDIGTYVYGQKELWYVSKIETKTHVLVFELSERTDMTEANGEFPNSGMGTKSGLKIDKISLYLKDDYRTGTNPTPLQEVHFDYDYSLCKGVRNNSVTTPAGPTVGGKLTLKKIWFTYEGSNKGALTPYQFTYDGGTNYNYDQFSYDRWGGYKGDGATDAENDFNNRYLPYVKQFSSADDSTFQAEKDSIAGAWSLSKIDLPSGGTIQLEYEADDYAYVQDEQATQMFEITQVNPMETGSDLLYAQIDEVGANDFDNPRSRRIYFEFEDPLVTGQSETSYATTVYEDYVENLIVDGKGDRNLYFKNYTDLRDGIYDYVSGYVAIDDSAGHKRTYESTDYYLFGIDSSSSSGGFYHKGFLTLKQQIKKINHDEDNPGDFSTTYYKKYHPMALAAWQHIRLNDPLLLTAPASFDLTFSSGDTDEKKAENVSSLLGFIPSTISMFTGIWAYCRNNNFGRRIDLSKSVIRLTTPDKKKYGGGHRIKQVQIADNWDDFSGETAATYGVEYTYTTKEISKEISSGVAQYEPQLGGDEIALRYPKFYINNVPFKANNTSFAEQPINESLFPSPTVGYSKVIVRSINTGNQIRNAEEPGGNTSGIGTTGITEYEFYTAKDYPVIVEEETIEKSHLNLPIPVPFVGVLSRKRITAVQAYKIELNDMHGKARSITKMGLNNDYTINEEQTSRVSYNYFDTETYINKKNTNHYTVVRRLDNEVDAIKNELGVPTTEKRIVGVEYDFMTDQRQQKSNTIVAGGNFNVDLVTVGPPPAKLPFPAFWPVFSVMKENMKTFTTNKIIFKSGILKSTETFDGKARVITTNEVFDAETGRPLITSVNNEFEDKLYNYSHPAHWEYDRMGGAYQNIDLKFEASLLAEGALDGHFHLQTESEVIDQLVSGDVIMTWYPETTTVGDNPAFTATYLGETGTATGIIHVDAICQTHAGSLETSGDTVFFKVIRSGRRNHVYTDAGTLVSKQLPVNHGTYSPDVSTRTVNVSETIGADSYSFPNFEIDQMNDVVNASAVLYRDEWANDPNSSNPFASGEAGVWRPYRSYVYAGARNKGTHADTAGIRNNGDMDTVDLFNWQIADFERYADKWEWTTEIARYNSEAYEVENVDRLGIRSAALYGSKGSLTLAVGANAGYHEIGVEDFEDYTDQAAVNERAKEEEDNMNFFNQTLSGSSVISRNYKIERGIAVSGTKQYMLELDTQDDFSGVDTLKVAIQTSAFTNAANTVKAYSQTFLIPCKKISSTISGGKTHLKVESVIKISGTIYSFIDANKLLGGRVTVTFDTNRGNNATTTEAWSLVDFVDDKAHTGTMAMRLEDSAGYYVFPQGKLDLKSGKTYVLSAWVSMGVDTKDDFPNVTVKPVEWDGGAWVSNILVGTYKTSRVVEGWQKVEVEFIPAEDDIGIEVLAASGLSDPTYVDDIRISPKTGGVVSYVYDRNNFRMAAMLDNNNYATLYFYDEQGNLHLVKRETERGIQTISENRGHNKTTASN